MTEAQARRQLRQMLRTMTPGSPLHLLAELFADSARRAARKGDEKIQKQAQEVASALFVVGLGVDAACPR
jgi:hypothetical protein